MKLSVFLLFSGIFTLSANVNALSQKVTLKVENVELREVFRSLEQQTGHIITYSEDRIDSERTKITADFEEMELREVLDRILKDLPYTYSLMEQRVFIIPAPGTENLQLRQNEATTIRGTVTDEGGSPLIGVTVLIKGTQRGVITDAQGRFSLNYAATGQAVVVFSFVGKKTVEVPYREGQEMNVVMEEDSTSVEEVVVTGLYTRAKESFTGSVASFTAKELKMVGTGNILQSLSALDPSFVIAEDNIFGSDPNRLPDIDIRGKASIISLTDRYESDPNQPLVMIDGFESTLQKLNDLSMDMIESITILKDAASTAIYGSKASNGVLVVETRRPEAGKLRVNYNANVQLAWADLSQYNLMNAGEKLEYEKLSGVFNRVDSDGNFENTFALEDYNRIYEDVLRGVDTYWLKEPIRFSTTHRHTVFVDGGADELRYSMGVVYGNTQGVMKGSDRENITGNVKLIYRKNKLDISNILEVQNVASNNPTIGFSSFAMANPYFRKTDENGEVIRKWTKNGMNFYSPLYDMNRANYNKGTNFGFDNKLEVKWFITDKILANGKFGISNRNEKTEIFQSPFLGKYQEAGYTKDTQGEYSERNLTYFSYNLDATVSYGDVINEKHIINAVGGVRLSESKNKYSYFSAQGFTDDDFGNPKFAIGYPEGRPEYSKNTTRSASFFINANYAFANRYLIDFNLTHDGSSVFGLSRHFTTTWSFGLGWNIHKESFFKNVEWIDFLKLRGSIGNPGNQNFTDYISIRIYEYLLDNSNYFGPGMTIQDYGNSDLDWQKTIDQNYGLDIQFLDNRLRINIDYYNKLTDPLVVYIGVPPSSSTTERPTNLGTQRTEGVTFTAMYQIIRNENMIWSVKANGRHQTYRYGKLGDSLAKFNEENHGSNLKRFYDGGSPDDLWAVRSAGIDPISGREIFITKDGRETFVFSYDDEVKVGTTTPKLTGTFGTILYYKGFTFQTLFSYRVGGQEFYNTIYDKVENISDGQRYYNRDKRALYDRWKKPGDIAKFRSIALTDAIPMSSRFVIDRSDLQCTSISLGYDVMGANWLQKIRASSFSFNLTMNDIFRLSTIKNERGIEYPFQRSVSFAVGITF